MLKISTTKFDPAKWPEGVWGTYAPGARLKIRKLATDVVQELRKPYVRMEMEVDKVSRRMLPVEHVDDNAFDAALTQYLIEDWEGFGDEQGLPLPNTLASRQALMNCLPIKDWIWAFAQSQEMIARKDHENELKNSQPSPANG